MCAYRSLSATTDNDACELLQSCLPLLTEAGSFSTKDLQCICQGIKAATVDLCYSVKHAADLLVLRQREAQIYTVLLSLAGKHRARLAESLTYPKGASINASLASSPPAGSVLAELLQICASAAQSTTASRAVVMQLAGRCACASGSAAEALLGFLAGLVLKAACMAARRIAAVAAFDCMFVHAGALSSEAWQLCMNLLQDCLHPAALDAEVQQAAVIATGRLLMQAAEVCDNRGCAEQLLAALLQLYVQTTGNRTTAIGGERVQKVLHIFFHGYRDCSTSSSCLTSAIVALLQQAAQDQVLLINMRDMALFSNPTQPDAVDALRLRCKFAMRLIVSSVSSCEVCIAVAASLQCTFPCLSAANVQAWLEQ
ncbi:hypothetical protein WJX72_006146 [[Myrmecia] bisecta]|uniref:Uncharacterized protein n=1 Tax=[Myrmecia] bisecta TaxID=41462 RepID=A0AAW1PTW6_9CHLO